MKIMKRLVVILITLAMIFVLASNLFYSFAISGSVVSNFSGDGAQMYDADNMAGNIIGTILDVVRFAGMGIGLIILTVLGAKYMLSSPNERAEIKQHAVVYIVGAVVMFGASAIVGIAKSFASANIKQ